MAKANLKLVSSREPERICEPSPEFVARGRKVDLESPTKFIPTVKGENDVVI